MKPIISCPPLPLRVAAAASVAAAMTIPTLTAYAGSAPASGPNPGVQGWLADPLPQSLAATAAPPWAQELAKTSVTTNPSDPHFTQDVADTAVHLYQHCLNLASRCHAPALADVQGLVGSVGSTTHGEGHLLRSSLGSPSRTIHTLALPEKGSATRPRTTYTVASGTPYYGTSGTATYVMGNQTPAGPNDNSTAMIEPNGSGYVNYCGPGSARVLARSWTAIGSGSPPANSFSWYASNISGFNENTGGTPYNANLVTPINQDIYSKTQAATVYGASASPDSVVTNLQSHLGYDVSNDAEPMIVSGTTAWLPSWPSSSSAAHIISLYQYNFTNGQSNISYNDTANVNYGGNTRDGQIGTDINHIFNSMQTPASSGNSRDVDVW